MAITPRAPLAGTKPIKNFKLFMNAYSGSFNPATDPYDDTGTTIVKKAYTDNGIAKMFRKINLTDYAGQYMFTENYVDISRTKNGIINGQYSFLFNDGVIYAIGSNNQSNEFGYPKAGETLTYSIVGGSGKYLNAKGNIQLDIGLENFTLISFMFN